MFNSIYFDLILVVIHASGLRFSLLWEVDGTGSISLVALAVSTSLSSAAATVGASSRSCSSSRAVRTYVFKARPFVCVTRAPSVQY